MPRDQLLNQFLGGSNDNGVTVVDGIYGIHKTKDLVPFPSSHFLFHFNIHSVFNQSITIIP